MRKTIILITAVLLISCSIAAAQTGADLLEQAQKKLQDAEFEAAMKIYDRILGEPGVDSVVTASARIDRAMTRHLLARLEAVKEYNEIIQTHSAEARLLASTKKRIDDLALGPGIYVAEFDPTFGKVHSPVGRLSQWGTKEQFPVWSRDGESLALNHRAGLESTIVVRHIATRRDIVQAWQGPQLGPTFWTAKSDGVLSVSNARRGRFDASSLYQRSFGNRLARIDLKGKAQQQSDLSVEVSSSQSAISPDGNSLYANTFTGNGDFITGTIIEFDVATGKQRQVFSLPADKNSLTAVDGPAAGRYISLSPDGKTLAIIRRPPDIKAFLAVVGVNGDDYRELVTGEGTLRTVAWTGDSRSVLYTRLKPNTTDTWMLMQIPAKGGDAVFTGLEVTGLSYLDVSPDGMRIAFDGSSYALSIADAEKK